MMTRWFQAGILAIAGYTAFQLTRPARESFACEGYDVRGDVVVCHGLGGRDVALHDAFVSAEPNEYGYVTFFAEGIR